MAFGASPNSAISLGPVSLVVGYFLWDTVQPDPG
jgi:hypothetical protein